LIACIVTALRASGLSQKEAALTMAVDQGQFSRFLSDESSVDVRRFAQLPETFWRALTQSLAVHVGLVVREPSPEGEALSTILVACAQALRGEPLRMAKADLPSAPDVRRRA
jgi:hypothetical protein